MRTKREQQEDRDWDEALRKHRERKERGLSRGDQLWKEQKEKEQRATTNDRRQNN